MKKPINQCRFWNVAMPEEEITLACLGYQQVIPSLPVQLRAHPTWRILVTKVGETPQGGDILSLSRMKIDDLPMSMKSELLNHLRTLLFAPATGEAKKMSNKERKRQGGKKGEVLSFPGVSNHEKN